MFKFIRERYDLVFAITMVLCAAIYICVFSKDCESKGGQVARGAILLVCVAKL